MSTKILNVKSLEEIFQREWSNFLDYMQLMRIILSDVRDNKFKEIKQDAIPPKQTKISITKTILNENENSIFDFWVEFSIPKNKGVVIGTNIYALNKDGTLSLKESFGTYFEQNKII